MAKSKRLKIPTSLQEAIEETIKHPANEKTVEQIADDCQVNPSLVYRWAYPGDSTSFADLPLRRVRDLIESTESFFILDYLETRFKRFAIKLPKGILPKKEEGQILDDYRELTIDVINHLKTFLSNPTKENLESVDNILSEIISKSASVKLYCKKKVSGQFELEL